MRVRVRAGQGAVGSAVLVSVLVVGFNPGHSGAALTVGLGLQHSDRGADTLGAVSLGRDRSPGS